MMSLRNCFISSEGWLNSYLLQQLTTRTICNESRLSAEFRWTALARRSQENASFGRVCEYYYSKFHLLIWIQFAWIICVRIFIFATRQQPRIWDAHRAILRSVPWDISLSLSLWIIPTQDNTSTLDFIIWRWIIPNRRINHWTLETF